MSNIIRFILEHYEAIFGAVFSLAASVISFVSYSRSRRASAIAEILCQIPTLCSQIESLFPNGNGVVKLDFVLKQVEKLCDASRLPFDKQYYMEQIEKVLSAPSSKKIKEVYYEKTKNE